ncbi:MAG TPA: hypothetical protein VNT79_07650 [Phycisphaerae bacterium]|nr:hypothetical protein [Phycisphaerae bacterium]
MTIGNANIPTAEADALEAVLRWAVEKRIEANVSYSEGARWISLRTNFLQYDSENNILQLAVLREGRETGPSGSLPGPGHSVGISFRRGHRKCLFLSTLLLVQPGNGDSETLIVRVPKQVRSVQRRAYQRVVVPEGHFVAAKIWEGGAPQKGAVAWPVCSGKLINISMGGALVEARVDQNPRLSSGEIVGIEITARPGVSLLFDGMFRHSVASGACHLGLGFHFPALEHETPGRSSISDLSEFINRVRGMRC